MEDFIFSESDYINLAKKDKRLAAAMEKIGPVHRQWNPDFFSALIRSFIEQQISMKAAETIWNRLISLTGYPLTPEKILSFSDEEISQHGISLKKVSYMKQASQKIIQKELNISELYSLSDNEVCELLCSLNGVGLWTAEMLMIFSLNRRNILSYGDLGIRRGLCILYHHKTLTKTQFERYRKRYSPYGTLASLYLWAISSGELLRD